MRTELNSRKSYRQYSVKLGEARLALAMRRMINEPLDE